MNALSGKDRLWTFEEILNEELDDPKFRAEWTRLAPARAVSLCLVRYRIEHGLTQTALSRLVGLSQPAIARLGGGDYVPSLETLIRLADALGVEFLVSIRPSARAASWVSPEVEQADVFVTAATTSGGEILIAAG